MLADFPIAGISPEFHPKFLTYNSSKVRVHFRELSQSMVVSTALRLILRMNTLSAWSFVDHSSFLITLNSGGGGLVEKTILDKADGGEICSRSISASWKLTRRFVIMASISAICSGVKVVCGLVIA